MDEYFEVILTNKEVIRVWFDKLREMGITFFSYGGSKFTKLKIWMDQAERDEFDAYLDAVNDASF